MPGFNGTGPRGMGPGTGGGRGPCGGGRRRPWCYGGRGWGWNAGPAAWGAPYPAATDETAYLESQVQALKGELQEMERRLEDLKGEK